MLYSSSMCSYVKQFPKPSLSHASLWVADVSVERNIFMRFFQQHFYHFSIAKWSSQLQIQLVLCSSVWLRSKRKCTKTQAHYLFLRLHIYDARYARCFRAYLLTHVQFTPSEMFSMTANEPHACLSAQFVALSACDHSVVSSDQTSKFKVPTTNNVSAGAVVVPAR